MTAERIVIKSNWKKRSELRKRLNDLVWTHSAELQRKPTEAARALATAAFETESEDIISQLYWLDTAKWVRRAKRYGVKPPPHWLITGEEPFWHTNNRTNLTYLTDNGLAKLRHETKEAMFSYWERWARIIVPTLSLLVAMIALLQRPKTVSCPPCPPVTQTTKTP
jgi:hypothetical protein